VQRGAEDAGGWWRGIDGRSAKGTGKREEEGLLILLGYPTEQTSCFRLTSSEIPALGIVLQKVNYGFNSPFGLKSSNLDRGPWTVAHLTSLEAPFRCGVPSSLRIKAAYQMTFQVIFQRFDSIFKIFYTRPANFLELKCQRISNCLPLRQTSWSRLMNINNSPTLPI
jgi:hypothetical protein